MKKLTLTDLWLVIDNMIRLRLSAVGALESGAFLTRQLQSLHQRIGAIPGIQTNGRPLAEELAVANVEHDAFGRALDHLLSAYEALGARLPDEIQANIAKIRRDVIDGPGALSVGYVDTAIAAKRRRQALDALGGPLGALPFAGFDSAAELAERFTAHGERIEALLQERAQAESEQDRQNNALRFKALALMANLRQGIEQHRRGEQLLEENTLPDNIESQIFGYANALLQLRASGNTTDAPEDDIDLPPSPAPTA